MRVDKRFPQKHYETTIVFSVSKVFLYYQLNVLQIHTPGMQICLFLDKYQYGPIEGLLQKKLLVFHSRLECNINVVDHKYICTYSRFKHFVYLLYMHSNFCLLYADD